MIIAVDFDGVLCENNFPEIGKPNYAMITLVQHLIDDGHEVILWTTRNGKELEKAVEWCEYRGLHFCAVNEPAPSNELEYRNKYDSQSRKIYADVYIDDHNLDYVVNAKNWTVIRGTMIKQVQKGMDKWNQTEEN